MTKELVAETGRGDIKLPELPEGQVSRDDVLLYFRQFWEVNEDLLPPFSRTKKELVVPAEGDKPLVVVRHNFTESSGWHSRDEFGINKIKSTGFERHEVLTPPSTAGRFVTQLSVSYEHTSGTGHPNSFPVPRVEFKDKEHSPYLYDWNQDELSTALSGAIRWFKEAVS